MNCYYFLELVGVYADSGSRSAESDMVKGFFKDEELIKKLWSGVVARKPQFRFKSSVEDLRVKLVNLRVPEDWVPAASLDDNPGSN